MAPNYVIIVRERYETYGLKAWQFLKQGKEIWHTTDVETAKQKYLETLRKYPYNSVKIMHDLTPLIDADFHGCTPGDNEPTYDPMNERLVYQTTSPVYIDEMLLMEGFEPYEVDVEGGSSYDPVHQEANLDNGSYSNGTINTGSIVPVDVDVENSNGQNNSNSIIPVDVDIED